MTDLLKFNKVAQLLGIFLLLCASSCSNDLVESRNSGSALGTTYSIIFYDSVARDYQKEIDSVFNAINQSMSTYIPTSDISRINAGDTTVIVDAMFKEVFEEGYNYHLMPEVTYGINKNLMVRASAFVSNRSNSLYTEGGNVFAKYRFFSMDDLHSHYVEYYEYVDQQFQPQHH